MSILKDIHMQKLRTLNIKGDGETTHGFYNSGGEQRTRDAEGKKTKACQLWENMRVRTQYWPLKDEKRMGRYADVIVCDEWKDFQKFSQWFDQVRVLGFFQDGWQLDKDLLFKGNKEYSPVNCVFLPEEVNKALNIKPRARGSYPVGICPANRSGKIDVRYDCKDERFKLRKYMDEREINLAFDMYKEARKGYIVSLAEKYKEYLDPRAYSALLSYEIEIDD